MAIPKTWGRMVRQFQGQPRTEYVLQRGPVERLLRCKELQEHTFWSDVLQKTIRAGVEIYDGDGSLIYSTDWATLG